MTCEADNLRARLLGRAAFLRDRGEIKTPELLECAASAIEARRAETGTGSVHEGAGPKDIAQKGPQHD